MSVRIDERTSTYTNEYTRVDTDDRTDDLALRTNPYVGLRPFFDDDHLYFFGRERQTAELLDILRQHRFLGVVGSSGCGKSSLVRAGLLPALLSGFLVKDRDRWRRIQMKPGDAPLGNLAAGLLRATGDEHATEEARRSLEQLIRDGHTDAVIDFLKPRLEHNANLFLLVDQFEEIFAFRGLDLDEGAQPLDADRRKERARRKAEAADFVDLILALADRHELPIYVTLTMRTDFLGDCDVFFGLPEALNRGRYLVPRMTRDELRDAVECPALLLGASVAPRLKDLVLNAFGDRFDQLPMLQHALLRTWDAWQQSGGLGSMDVPHYEQAGGLDGALNRDAEKGALRGLDVDVTARVFKRLTDTDLSQRRIRSPARISELMSAAGVGSGLVEGILKRFKDDGRNFVHLSADGKPDDPRVDISHESLIRQWRRLRNWVDEERQSRDQYQELVDRAQKQPRTLLRDPELQTFIDWKEKSSPSPGWAARYSATEDEYETAMRYLDESVDLRINWRAETEYKRLWWFGWQLIAAFAVLYLVARDLVVRLGANDDLNVLGGIVQYAIDSKWLALKFLALVATPLLLYALYEALKRFHRWYFLPQLVQEFQATGGQPLHRHPIWILLKGLRRGGRPVEREPKRAVVEFKDAIEVHGTTYASAFRRVGAYLIDLVVSLPVTAIALLVIIPRPFEEHWHNFSATATLVTFLLVGWLYTAPQLASSRMATVGMSALGIFRTDLRGERVSFARATAWYAARILSMLVYGLGFLTQLLSDRRQTLHDRLAASVVLRRPTPPVTAATPDVMSRPVSAATPDVMSRSLWRSPRMAWAVGVLAYVAGVSFLLWRGLAAAPLLDVDSVSVAQAPASILKGGEDTVGYRLILATGDTVTGTRAGEVLRQSGAQLLLHATPDSIVDIHQSRNPGTFDLRGLKKGEVKIWAVLNTKNKGTIVSRDSVSVAVIQSTDEMVSAALQAYAALDAKSHSDTVTDESLETAVVHIDSTFGTILRKPELGLGNDLDEALESVHALVRARHAADALVNNSKVALLDRTTALRAYLDLRMTVRDSHGPPEPDFGAILQQLEQALGNIDGTVLAPSVCQAPCNTENQLDTLFRSKVNVVIRLRYKFAKSGRLTIEWWRDAQLLAAKPYEAAATPTGYRLWDQKNVGQEGNWEVRVLNSQRQPVFRHAFVVQ